MKLENKDGVLWLRMEAGKANAISDSFLTALDGLLDELHGNTSPALILTGYDRHFSAGLNLLELWEYDRMQLTHFLEKFSGVFLKLVRLPQVIIAAINGNAIAGGAIIAQTAEYRIMAQGDARIGVNEVQLGIPFPRQVLEIVKARLPYTSHFDAIYRGMLFGPEEALKIGFVDEVCVANELEDRAFKLAKEFSTMSFEAVSRIKRDMSAFHVEKLEMLGRLGDTDFIDIWFSPDTRKRLGTVVDTLKAKKR